MHSLAILSRLSIDFVLFLWFWNHFKHSSFKGEKRLNPNALKRRDFEVSEGQNSCWLAWISWFACCEIKQWDRMGKCYLHLQSATFQHFVLVLVIIIIFYPLNLIRHIKQHKVQMCGKPKDKLTGMCPALQSCVCADGGVLSKVSVYK